MCANAVKYCALTGTALPPGTSALLMPEIRTLSMVPVASNSLWLDPSENVREPTFTAMRVPAGTGVLPFDVTEITTSPKVSPGRTAGGVVMNSIVGVSGFPGVDTAWAGEATDRTIAGVVQAAAPTIVRREIGRVGVSGCGFMTLLRRKGEG